MDEHGETNQSIGDIVHLDKSTISRYLNKQMSPKVTTIKILAQHFNLNPAWLMGYNVDRSLDKVSEEQAGYSAYSEKEKQLIHKYRKLTDNQKVKLEGVLDSYEIDNENK